MQSLVSSYSGITICPLKVRYPQGGEKQLIDAIIRRQVPSGGLPISTGAVVQNVGTAFAVYEAIQKNKPLFERIVTVTGKSLKSPSNFLVRIGTPIGQLIDAAGGLPDDTEKIVSGGPMMGGSIDRYTDNKRLFRYSPDSKSRSRKKRNVSMYSMRKMCSCMPDGTRT